ncbi:ORF6N domain-containing protein, partial [Symbiobacterium thermophilum]
MNNVVRLTINQQTREIEVKEYAGQRVVTFRDVDELHRRPEGTAGRNFRQNRHRFIEGTDFFELDQPDEIRRLGLERPQGGVPEKIILITESGYLMLVKSFTDDLSWEVQRALVNSYFRAKEQRPLTQVEALLQAVTILAEQERRLAAVESRVIAIESRQREAEQELQSLPEPTGPVADVTTRALLNRLVRAYSVETGIPHNSLWRQLYREFRDRYHIDLVARSTKSRGPLDVAESLGHIQT